ncbi:TonB-dependent siderophore receptor [Variovorax sp. LT1R16]|uniref:TonB-dependent siderophore receptor n=1 Tax=Variovorax sp. LT1R16 TaxID=3443728 RepID=UPI003F4680DD
MAFSSRPFASFAFAPAALAVAVACLPFGAQAQAVRAWDLPAGPLGATLLNIAQQSGQPIAVSPELVRGRSAPAVQGQLTTEQAALAALAGQPLQLLRTPNGTLTVREHASPAAASAGATTVSAQTLSQVTVTADAERESPRGPLAGYVARRSASGSKTDTALLETPQAINIVTRDQMKDQGARTVAEALRYTAGVVAEPNGFDVRYDWNYIRGYDTFGMQWLDGLALPGDPLNYAVPRISAYALERIEVIKGPASVLYGKAVPGGMLNQVSKRPLPVAQREVQVSTTNFGGAEVAADLTGPLDADGQWLYRLVALQREAHTQVDLERDRQTLIAPSLTWRPSADTSLTLQAYYQKDDPLMSARFYPVQGTLRRNPAGQIPRSVYLGEPSTDSFHRDYRSIGYAFEHRFDDTWSVRQNLRYGHAKQDMFLVRAHPFNALQADGQTLNRVSAISDDDVRSFSVDNQIEARLRTGAATHTLLAGVDHVRGKLSYNFANSAVGVPTLNIFRPVYGQAVLRPTAFTNSSAQDVTQTGLYLQDQVRLGRFIATLGLRHDQSKLETTNRIGTPLTVVTDDAASTGRFGITYVFDNGLAPYANYSTSFLPTAGVDRLGTPFRPQKGAQIEAGLKYEPTAGWGFVTTSVYQNDLQNGRTPDPVNSSFSVQTGEQRVRGLELEAKAELSKQLSVIGAYAYTDSKVTRSNNAVALGRNMLQVPRHQASAWIQYRFASVAGLEAGMGGRYMSAYDTAAAYLPELRIPSLFLWDLGASYDLGALGSRYKGAKLRLTAANVSDKRYVSHCLMTVGSPCNYGARRTVTATLSYAW